MGCWKILKLMNRFFLLLWIFWLAYVVFWSFVLGSLLATVITLFLYIRSGMPEFTDAVVYALLDVGHFLFMITYNIALLIVLFLSIKQLFKRCFDRWRLELIGCLEYKTVLSDIGYGDLIHIWRRWMMYLVWFSAFFMIVNLIFSKVFGEFHSVFEWFDIYHLYSYIAIGGFFALRQITINSKYVKVKSC